MLNPVKLRSLLGHELVLRTASFFRFDTQQHHKTHDETQTVHVNRAISPANFSTELILMGLEEIF